MIDDLDQELEKLQEQLFQKRIAECEEAEEMIRAGTAPLFVEEMKAIKATLDEKLAQLAQSRLLSMQNLDHFYEAEIQCADDELRDEKRKLKEHYLEKCQKKREDILEEFRKFSLEGGQLQDEAGPNMPPPSRHHTHSPDLVSTDDQARTKRSRVSGSGGESTSSTSSSGEESPERVVSPSTPIRGASPPPSRVSKTPALYDVKVVHGKLHYRDQVFEKVTMTTTPVPVSTTEVAPPPATQVTATQAAPTPTPIPIPIIPSSSPSSTSLPYPRPYHAFGVWPFAPSSLRMAQAFAAGDYQEALATLKQKDPGGSSWRHNMALTEFMLNRARDPFELCQSLTKNDVVNRSRTRFQTALRSYNLAVVNVTLKQYSTALKLLTPVQEYLGLLAEGDLSLALRILFLLLDIHLRLSNTNECLRILSFIHSLRLDFPGTRPRTPVLPHPQILATLHMYRTRTYLMLRNSLSQFHIQALDPLSTQLPSGKSTLDLLKANQEATMGNLKEAMKILDDCYNELDPELLAVCFNDMGCVHHCQHQSHLASYCFSKALSESESHLNALLAERPPSPHSKSSSPVPNPRQVFAGLLRQYRPEILANSALELLHTGLGSFHLGRVMCASGGGSLLRGVMFRCLLLRHPAPMRSRVLLPVPDVTFQPTTILGAEGPAVRNALALVDAQLESLDDSVKRVQQAQKTRNTRPEAEQQAAVQAALAQYKQGSLAHIALEDQSSHDYGSSPSGLRGVFALVGDATVKGFQKRISTLHQLRHAALSGIAYCSLELCDPTAALAAAQQLLGCPEPVSEVHRFLGHIYAGKALCLQGRLSDAVLHLNHRVMGRQGGAWAIPSYDGRPETSLDARAVLYVNLATVCIMQNNLAEAIRSANHAMQVAPHLPQVALCSVYIALRQGLPDQALHLLKRKRHIQEKAAA
ncbi:hypothetical protein PAPYR_8443 [Paratrimastix pyriformis]|uniref:CCR4-NOT transcription complex subunit 10 n=1 Tax=Paratrimastix pyriformis TaxID=342808 RepID=A0ABQ8UF71_9EUKA|nr:hypothetical protein PAPYR_8443 [Paratrimastix pyriformis]